MGSIDFTGFFAKIRLKIRCLWIFEGSPVIMQCIIPYLSTNTIIRKGRYRSYGYCGKSI